MKTQTMILSAVASLLLAHGAARADLVELPQLSPAAREYSIFFIKDFRKTTQARATQDLTALLAPLNRQPCFVLSDRGAPFTCADGAMTIGSTHAYTYNLQLSFPTVLSELRALDPQLYKGAKLPTAVGQAWGVNFLPPPTDGITPCTGACNQVGPVTLTYSQPVSEMGVAVDAGDTVLLTQQLRIVVNGQELIKDLALGINFVRIADIDPATGANVPITSVVLDPIGGQSSAFVLDRLAYTLAK